MKNPAFSQLFANKNFLKLWASQMLSQFTIQLMSFYILTYIFARTESTIAVSLLWMAGAIPSIIFGPFSGTIVDRFSRRNLMLITNLLQALTVASCIFITKNIFPFYMVAFTYWFLDLIYYPSQQASAPALVSTELLPAANGLFLLTQQVSIIVGFAVGGILLSTIGRVPTILLATLNLVLAAVAIYFLPKDPPVDSKSASNVFDFWHQLHVGYDYILSHREISLPLLLITASQILITIISTSAPTYTHEILHLALNQVSLYLIIPGTLGALAMTYAIQQLQKKYRKKQFIEFGLLMGSLALLSLSLVAAFPNSYKFLVIFISFSLGISVASITVTAQSLLQEKTPAWMQGRVYGQLGFLLNLATFLPVLFAATLADTIGIVPMLSFIGFLVLLGFIFIKTKGDYVLANGIRF